ncbi:MAG: ChbG/HpnK family deacetylase [Candidatus Dormibacteraeota bacterium]|nr:ChbG/HpnK family deacetylase [Candidatus Dormibacteraeota bacterium]
MIVNADDFGLSTGVNQGITRAHQQGIVMSASLMARKPRAAEAADYARRNPSLSLGLHVDLGEWAYRDGDWVRLYEVVPEDDAEAVAAEVARQLAAFRQLVGRNPTHLDSHQHVHREGPVRSVMAALAHELGVPLRDFDPQVRYCGDFYGQTAEGLPLPGIISVSGLAKILAALPPGVTELGCHPGDGEEMDTMYWRERAEETRVLCDPRVRGLLAAEGIELRSFSERGIEGLRDTV